MTMSILFVLAFVALLLLMPFSIVWLTLSASRECPFCGGETIVLRTVLTRVLRRWLVRRWCVRCAWEGFTRAERRKPNGWALERVREGGDGQRSGTSRGS